MNKLYKFSPITSKEELVEAIEYVARETTELCRKITNKEYPIISLTIFAHYPEEFKKLKEILNEMGEVTKENNGPFIKLNQPIELPNNKLELLRVRHPDPYRMQVGCNDFEIPDYAEFKKQFIKNDVENLRIIERPEYEMIEFFDPDYDVLAYVLSSEFI